MQRQVTLCIYVRSELDEGAKSDPHDMTRLERVDGPECKNCGCADAAIVQRFERWGKPYVLRPCGFCGVEFQAPDVESNGHTKPTEDDRCPAIVGNAAATLRAT